MNEMLIFIYPTMNPIGGIQEYIYYHVQNALNAGTRVGWIKSKDGEVHDGLKDVMDAPTLWVRDEVNFQELQSYLRENAITKLNIITFAMFDFETAEITKKNITTCPVNTFYFVPHFEGAYYYLEEYFEHDQAAIIQKQLSELYLAMQQNGNLYYFDKKHEQSMHEHYGIPIEKPAEFLVPLAFENLPFDSQKVWNLYHRSRFNILIVSRMFFPHKGFMIGALKAFIRLKPQYGQLELTVVGDGEGMERFKKIVSECPEETSKDIHLIGTVPPRQLYKYYDDANLLISVAGCLLGGARRGILSIPAQHYSYSCDGYGFLPDCVNCSLETRNGISIDTLIKQAIQMSYETYYELCLRTSMCYNKIISENNSKTLMSLENVNSCYTLSNEQIELIEKAKKQREWRIKHHIRSSR